MDALVAGAARLDDTPGLVRPITVNLLGHILAEGERVRPEGMDAGLADARLRAAGHRASRRAAPDAAAAAAPGHRGGHQGAGDRGRSVITQQPEVGRGPRLPDDLGAACPGAAAGRAAG